MTITYLGGDAGGDDSADPITLTLPAHQANDFSLIAGHIHYANRYLSVSGWDLLIETHINNQGQSQDSGAYIFYRRHTGSGEANPSVVVSESSIKSVTMATFRGVDPVNAFDAPAETAEGQDNARPPNPPITTVTTDAALVLFQSECFDRVTAPGAPDSPAGMVLGECIYGASAYNRQIFAAYKLQLGAPGLYTPAAWTHTVTNGSDAEWQAHTIALRSAAGAPPSTAHGLQYGAQAIGGASLGAVGIQNIYLGAEKVFDAG